MVVQPPKTAVDMEWQVPAKPSLAGLLDAEAAKRFAMEEHLLKSTKGDRRRKVAFRARMRR